MAPAAADGAAPAVDGSAPAAVDGAAVAADGSVAPAVDGSVAPAADGSVAVSGGVAGRVQQGGKSARKSRGSFVVENGKSTSTRVHRLRTLLKYLKQQQGRSKRGNSDMSNLIGSLETMGGGMGNTNIQIDQLAIVGRANQARITTNAARSVSSQSYNNMGALDGKINAFFTKHPHMLSSLKAFMKKDRAGKMPKYGSAGKRGGKKHGKKSGY
jgi:hypothetical protein